MLRARPLSRGGLAVAVACCAAIAGCSSAPSRHPSPPTSGRPSTTHAPTSPPSVASSSPSPPVSSTRPSPTPTPGMSLTADGGFVVDFAELPDQSLTGFRAPGGRVTSLQFDYDHTGLVVRHGRMVRGVDTAQGAPILIVPNRTAPTEVEDRFEFLPGTPATENVVLGTCASAFRSSSIQLAVWPDHWRLFYTLYDSGRSRTVLTVLAEGQFAAPLATDGRTGYQMSMRRTGTSTVELVLPGVQRTVSSPAIADYWGAQLGVQIRHPAGTAGEGAVTLIGDRLS